MTVLCKKDLRAFGQLLGHITQKRRRRGKRNENRRKQIEIGITAAC